MFVQNWEDQSSFDLKPLNATKTFESIEEKISQRYKPCLYMSVTDPIGGGGAEGWRGKGRVEGMGADHNLSLYGYFEMPWIG